MASGGVSAEGESSGKVSIAGETSTWGNPSDTTLTLALERLARSHRQWLNERLESELAQERRTINIRIEQESDHKGQEIATQRLIKNHEWILSEQQRLMLVEREREDTRRWLMSLFVMLKRHANTWIFFIGWTISMAAWGWVGGINTPVGITCHTRASLCYSLRFWGVKKAVSEPKKPLCTKTQLGLMCLIEPAPKKSTAASAPSASSSQRKQHK